MAATRESSPCVSGPERRVYRLAVLLIGSEEAAARVLDDVLDQPGRLKRLDGAHLDRLTVLRCRERATGSFMTVAKDPAVAGTLASMDAQPREAWVMSHVYGMQPRDAARAMDCSVTALNLHLNRAHELMRRKLGEPGANEAAARLGDMARTMEVPLEIVRLRHRRHRMRRAVRWLWIMCGVLAALAALAWGASRWTT